MMIDAETHTCYQGPTCGEWYSKYATKIHHNDDENYDWYGCEHSSCHRVQSHDQCYACLAQAMEATGTYCEEGHGWQEIVDQGSNPGFGNDTIYWANLACGCQLWDEVHRDCS